MTKASRTTLCMAPAFPQGAEGDMRREDHGIPENETGMCH